MKRFHLRLFALLSALGMFGAAVVLPYQFSIDRLTGQLPDAPLWILVAILIVQAGVFVLVTCALGVVLTRSVPFGIPYLEALVERRPLPKGFPRLAGVSIAVGAGLGALVVLIDTMVFSTPISESIGSVLAIPTWQRFLAAFYGGINEELLMRFFAMTLIAWIIARVARRPRGQVTSGIAWASIVVTALLFSVGQLYLTFNPADITLSDYFHAICLNGIAGAVLGILYWRRGLESAMVAHFTSSLMMFVVIPAFFSVMPA